MLSKGGIPCRAYQPDVPSFLNGDNPWLWRAAGSVTSTGCTRNREPLALPRTGARPASSFVPLPLLHPFALALVFMCAHMSSWFLEGRGQVVER